MITLLIRTAIVYFTLFIVIRLMGKRQISDMQPFDLVITLLIADVASVPISDGAIPLFYGVIPILTLYILHKLVAFLSLKSGRVRDLVCGKPVIIIEKGVVIESAMRAADYTLDDLTEQLRLKDVFSLSQVEYGILETNGSLSVLPKAQQPAMMQVRPSIMLISDGAVISSALAECGYDRRWLDKKMTSMGLSVNDCFFACLEPDGMLHAQGKQKGSSRDPVVRYLKVVS